MTHVRLARLTAAVAVAVPVLAVPLVAEDWSRFRGPNGSGVTSGADLPLEVGPETNVVWKAEVPFGRSTPVIGGERVFLTAAAEDEFLTLAYDRRSGAELWRSALARDREADMYHDQDSATPSPVTDGDNVYVFFQETGLVSYDADGNERWKLPLGPFANFYGMAASPVLSGDRLYLVCDQVRGSFLLAVDTGSGKVVWRSERPGRPESYATPILYPSADEPTALLVAGSKWMDAYDPTTGEALWSVSGLGASPVASPVLAGNMLFVAAPDHAPEPPAPFSELTGEHDANGDGALSRDEVEGTWMTRHFGFIDVDGDGSVSADDWAAVHAEMASEGWGVFGLRFPDGGSAPEIVWNHRQNVPYMPTPIVVGGRLYTVQKGIVTSLDPATGDTHHRGRLGNGSPEVYASPVAAGDTIYFGTLDGDLVAVTAADSWEVAATSPLDEPIYATPVVDGDRLLVRAGSTLYAFGSGG